MRPHLRRHPKPHVTATASDGSRSYLHLGVEFDVRRWHGGTHKWLLVAHDGVMAFNTHRQARRYATGRLESAFALDRQQAELAISRDLAALSVSHGHHPSEDVT